MYCCPFTQGAQAVAPQSCTHSLKIECSIQLPPRKDEAGRSPADTGQAVIPSYAKAWGLVSSHLLGIRHLYPDIIDG